jgi:hypothetical protein
MGSRNLLTDIPTGLTAVKDEATGNTIYVAKVTNFNLERMYLAMVVVTPQGAAIPHGSSQPPGCEEHPLGCRCTDCNRR